MGKKTKKNRFNQSVDVDVVYPNNTIADMDPCDSMAELNISEERAAELQKIRANLPAFSSSSAIDNELAKLPLEKPFRAFVYNVSSATEQEVADFFAPLITTHINMVSGEGGRRGFCFVDFDTREDLAKALERSNSLLAGRLVDVRIATPNNNDRSNPFGRERNSFAGGRRSDTHFERRRGRPYRPAALRDEMGDSFNEMGGSQSTWQRGDISHRSSPFGSGRPSNQFGTYEPQSSGFNTTGPEEPIERPKLNLLPRSHRTANEAVSDRNALIFGFARPVDTASKDRELEERLSSTTDHSIRTTSTLNP